MKESHASISIPFGVIMHWLWDNCQLCQKKRFCIWLDHNWSSSFVPNSCFQRSHRYSVEESEGRNDLAVDIYNDENDVDVDVFEDGIDIAMRGARVEMTWRWTQMMRLMTSWTVWSPSDPIFGPTIPDQIFFDRNLQTNLDCSNENEILQIKALYQGDTNLQVIWFHLAGLSKST